MDRHARHPTWFFNQDDRLKLVRAPDKQHGLVDCISMNAMSQRDIQEILTNDRHFSQEGFVRLLDLKA